MNVKAMSAVAVLIAIIGVAVVISSDASDAADDQTTGAIDTSEYAGDYYYYYAQDGTFKLGITINSNGAGVAYKAFSEGNSPANSTQENFTVIAKGDNPTNANEYQLTIRLIDRTPTQPTSYIWINKDLGSSSHDLRVQYASLVGTDAMHNTYPIQHFWKAGGSGYEIYPDPGFKPYSIESALRLSTGDVTLTLDSGTYSFVIDFFGDSLTIQSREGADVHISDLALHAARSLPSEEDWRMKTGLYNGCTTGKAEVTFKDVTFDKVSQTAIRYFSDVMIDGCTLSDTRLEVSKTTGDGKVVEDSHVTIFDCVSVYGGTNVGYSYTINMENVNFTGNTITGYDRGVNIQNCTGFALIEGNTFRNLTEANEGAVQIADAFDGGSFTIRDNVFDNVQSALAIHENSSGTPEAVNFLENNITNTDVGVLYKVDGDKMRTDVSVHADRNYFAPDGGRGQPLAVYVQDIGRDDSLIQEDSYYVDSDMDTTDDDVLPPSWDDEDDLPPFIPNQPAEGDDTVTIVACAAAAAVAAILAVFLVIDRKG